MHSDSFRLLVAGFVMGWGPCLAHSAPLLLPYIGATKGHWKDGLKIGLAFSGGRLLALGFLGGIATIAFSYINKFFPPHRSGWLYGIVALFMIAMGVLIVIRKGLRIQTGKSICDKGIESMFIFGLLMGVAPCVPYVAILTYIACVAENAVLKGVLYAVSFALGTAIAPIVLGGLTSIIPEKLLNSPKLLRAFQVFCGIVLIFFGARLLYFVFYVIQAVG
jgi:sulfite exporter TauE/SafE